VCAKILIVGGFYEERERERLGSDQGSGSHESASAHRKGKPRPHATHMHTHSHSSTYAPRFHVLLVELRFCIALNGMSNTVSILPVSYFDRLSLTSGIDL